MKGMGVTALPLDLEIFLWSGSSTHPLSVVSRQGRASCSRWERRNGGEEPGPDDLGALRPQAHRECRFSAPAEELEFRHVLQLEGLATIADVWVNGRHVLHSQNMFRAYEVETGPLEGDNELLVRFCPR